MNIRPTFEHKAAPARSPQYYYDRSRLERETERPLEARKTLEFGLRTYRDSATLWYEYGKLIEAAFPDETKLVEKCFRNAGKFARRDNDKLIMMQAAGAMTRHGIFDAAEFLYARLYFADENKTFVLMALSKHYQERGLPKFALACAGAACWTSNGDAPSLRRYEKLKAAYEMDYNQPTFEKLERRLAGVASQASEMAVKGAGLPAQRHG